MSAFKMILELVDCVEWAMLRSRLLQEMDPEIDSLRFYFLGKNWQPKVEHIGAKAVLDLNGPLIF